ncbi:MAG: hypothetical protein CL572_06005 [Alphaproteobacteria bacterium]|nr:hypothetical protein [Alphaproteobacteria bacterium]
MKKKINFFIFYLIIFFSFNLIANEVPQYIQPEPSSKKSNDRKFLTTKDFIVVTANDYATTIGFKVLKDGGNAVDSAIAIQILLGLVEPQSSGLGGGLFITYYDAKKKKTYSYEGREISPKKIQEDVFLDESGKPKKFFNAAIGGLSVGVPGTLKTLKLFHNDFGHMEWEKIINYAIEFSKKGFIPSPRLINALKKEKYLFRLNPNSIYKKIINNPKKKFFNEEYTNTLKTISQNYSDFYNGKIAKSIIKTVIEAKNPGLVTYSDFKSYKSKKQRAFCHKLDNNYTLCGPNLPSSGTICVAQALMIYESILKNLKSMNLNKILSILDFVYFLRSKTLADPDFEKIDYESLLDKKKLFENFKNFKKKDLKVKTSNINELINSTSHFSVIDSFGNVVSATSSIESSFGSRLFTNGFFLNNQLTDFSFKNKDENNKPIKNRPGGGKRPLSSMSPIIVLDKNDKPLLTIGSPGGKAIISYVFRVLIDVLYKDLEIYKSVQSPNFIKINGKIYLEDKSLKKKVSKDKSVIRNLTSGLAVIKKTKNGFIGVADYRRDGSVRGQ